MKFLLSNILFIASFTMVAQAPAFEELEFELDSVRNPYKPAGKNYVFVKSRRGTNGMAKSANADAIKSAEVSEIVLVYSELAPSDIADRDESNHERWENLLSTYPEFFQYSTTYKSVCQCNNNGDSAAFKRMQGFYVYVNGEVPKAVVEETKAAPAPPVAATTPAAATPQPAKTEEKKPTETKKAAETPASKPAKEIAITDNTSVKTKESPPAATPPLVKETPKEVETPAAIEPAAAEEEAPVTKTPAKNKPTVAAKARKAKDARACRPACYGYGDEDLYIFFKENMPLTKKQKRKAKGWIAQIRLQIHYDGTIKKTMVTGSNADFNKHVEDVLKAMNPWNTAVKNGTAVKSEVRFTLKYDKDSKSMKPFDMIMNPKPSTKCPCISDSEMFGSD